MDSKAPISDPNIPTAYAEPVLINPTMGNAMGGDNGKTFYCEKCHAVSTAGHENGSRSVVERKSSIDRLSCPFERLRFKL